jgi:hypothetical protein
VKKKSVSPQKKDEVKRNYYPVTQSEFAQFDREVVAGQKSSHAKTLLEHLSPLQSDMLRQRRISEYIDLMNPQKFWDEKKMTWEEFKKQTYKTLISRWTASKKSAIYQATISNMNSKMDILSSREFQSLVSTFDFHIDEYKNKLQAIESGTEQDSEIELPTMEPRSAIKDNWHGTKGQLAALLAGLKARKLIDDNCFAFGADNFLVNGKPTSNEQLRSNYKAGVGKKKGDEIKAVLKATDSKE